MKSWTSLTPSGERKRVMSTLVSGRYICFVCDPDPEGRDPVEAAPVSVEHRGEHARTVERVGAAPVDRSIGAHQRDAALVPDDSVAPRSAGSQDCPRAHLLRPPPSTGNSGWFGSNNLESFKSHLRSTRLLSHDSSILFPICYARLPEPGKSGSARSQQALGTPGSAAYRIAAVARPPYCPTQA